MKLYKTAYDMTGRIIGRLTIVEFSHRSKRGNWWRCVCACGNENYKAAAGDLNSGRIISCGCYRNSQEFADARVVHGARRQRKGETLREYNIWCGIKKRCYNIDAANYPWYGGKGIEMCSRWAISFENFYNDMGPCPPGFSIDRIDPKGNYEPSNCRWISIQENSRRAHG